MKKRLLLERKSGEGCILETPLGPIEVKARVKANGRVEMSFRIPDNVNLYRIDTKGKPQNKKNKDFIRGATQKKD